MSFISELADQFGTGFKIGIIIVVIILITVSIFNWSIQNQETLRRNTEVIMETAPIFAENLVKSCEIMDTTIVSLNETLAQSLENEVARELASKLLDENKLSECEWYEFINHLNEWEKRKLRVYDLACDFSSCLKQP